MPEKLSAFSIVLSKFLVFALYCITYSINRMFLKYTDNIWVHVQCTETTNEDRVNMGSWTLSLLFMANSCFGNRGLKN